MVTNTAKDLMDSLEPKILKLENVWCFLLFAVAHYKIAKLLEA